MRGTTIAKPPWPSEESDMSLKMIVLWLIVGIPLCFGIEQTLENTAKLFQ
jgi:hypothetical protein